MPTTVTPAQTDTQSPAVEPAKEHSPAEDVLQAARNFRKAYRAMGGARPEKIEEARQEARDLRGKVADLVDSPEEMDAAYKELRKAEARVDRMLNTTGNKKDQALEALKSLQTLVNQQIKSLSAKDDEDDK